MANFKYKLLLILLLISHFVLSQTKTVEIHDYTNGIKNISPSKIIEIKDDKTVEIYSVENGIKSITPTQIIKDNKVYETKNGLQELLPRQSIEIFTFPTFNSTPSLDFKFDVDNLFNF
jgi:hypothetical protein